MKSTTRTPIVGSAVQACSVVSVGAFYKIRPLRGPRSAQLGNFGQGLQKAQVRKRWDATTRRKPRAECNSCKIYNYPPEDGLEFASRCCAFWVMRHRYGIPASCHGIVQAA